MTEAEYARYHEADVIAKAMPPQAALAEMRELARAQEGGQAVEARMLMHALEIGDRAAAASIETILANRTPGPWELAGRSWYAAYDNRVGEAEALGAQAFQLDSVNVCALEASAFVACLRCDFARALEFSSAYAAADSANQEAYYRVFWTHILAGDEPAAAEYIRQAPASFVDSASHHAASAHLAWRFGDLERSAQCFRRATRRREFGAELWSDLSTVLLALGCDEDATEAAHRAIELNPISVGALLTLADAWHRRRKPRTGHTYERWAVLGHPLYACLVDLHVTNRAITVKDYAMALRCLKHAEKVGAPLYRRSAQLVRLEVLSLSGHWDELRSALVPFQNESPMALCAVIALASLLDCEGRTVEAADAIEQYLRRRPDVESGSAWLFSYLAKLDEPGRVAAAVDHVLRHPPVSSRDAFQVIYSMVEAGATAPANPLLEGLLAGFSDDNGLRWLKAEQLQAEGDVNGAKVIRDTLAPEWMNWDPRTEP